MKKPRLERGYKCILFLCLTLLTTVAVNAQALQQPYDEMALSNLHVQDIVQDKWGYVWIATARGLDRLDGYKTLFFLNNTEDNRSLANDNVYKLFVSRSGELFAFMRWGINWYDRQKNGFVKLSGVNRNENYAFVCEDARGTIWMGTSNNLSYIDRSSFELKSIHLPHISHLKDLCCNDGGYLCIVDGTGKDRILVFNPYTHKMVRRIYFGKKINRILPGPYRNTLYLITPNSVLIIGLSDKIGKGRCIFSSSGKNIEKTGRTEDGKLYFLTSDLQLYVLNKKSMRFNQISLSKNVNNIYDLTSVFIDKQSNIWIGTFEEGYRLIPYNKYNFNVDTDLSEHFKNIFVTSMTGDRKGRYWIATRHEGLQEYDKETNKLRTLLDISSKDDRMSGECCFYDSSDRLWVATREAVYCYSTKEKFSLKKKYNGLRIRYVYEDLQRNIWMITGNNEGVRMLPANSANMKLINPYPSLSALSPNLTYILQLRSSKYVFSCFGDKVYLSDSPGRYRPLIPKTDGREASFLRSVIYIYEDSKGILYLGTYSCGLMCYDPRSGKKEIFTMQNGLPSNDVLAITEDRTGHIWLSTSFGLSKISENNSFINYFTRDGLLGNQYHERSVYKENGIIYFTGNHGITSFRPETIRSIKCDLPFIIESIVSDYKTYVPYAGKMKKIVLAYRENSFTVSFLGFDFSSAKNLRYSYILDGYDEHWSSPSLSGSAKFSNVPAGTYTFKVKVCDDERSCNDKLLELKIVVSTAPWKTWWALLIYMIFAGFAIWWVLRLYINFKIDKEKIKVSEYALKKEKELSHEKISFFENISHELRTPLSLIYGPYCELSKEKGFSKQENKYIRLMGANIERLMDLVEQVLKFSTFNGKTMALSVGKTDIIVLTDKIKNRFQAEYESKHIDMEFLPEEEHFEMWVDEDKFDKILSNLLSNAFKYTPEGGKILITFEMLSSKEMQKEYDQKDMLALKYAQFSVKDTGIGVPKEDLERIFDRFYRSKRGMNFTSVACTGIGLHYIRSLVLKHKGFIKAELNEDRGMVFRFCLPVDAVYADSEKLGRYLEEKEEEYPFLEKEEGGETSDIKTKPKLLVVEDEPDLQLFLNELLQSYFDIQKAYDGKEGLQKAFETIPDIVLADVIMPLMNGYELCSQLKNDIHTSHIPVIMLTAKGNVEEQIQGMNVGADVYISKPFHPDYLISVLKGVLRNRERIQHIIVNEDFTDKNNKEDRTENRNLISKMDRELLEKLDKRIGEEMGDPDLSIDQLASELNFSRSTFYRKIKSLMGISPNEYLHVYRMKRSAELIESGEYTLLEIMDRTGFNTQSYFSAAFKKYFGMTPTEYKNLKFPKCSV